MANKLTGWCGNALAVIFTSIVAPLVVNLAVRSTSDEGSKPAREEQVAVRQLEASSPTYSSVPSQALSPTRSVQTVRVIASGVGHTPEAALQDALHTALRQALASVVDAETWARNGSALCAGALRDSGGLILGWKDLGAKKQWGRKGLVYHEEAVVEVNLTALAHRLRAGHTADRSNLFPFSQMQ